jgi:hypothetical protein
VGDEREEDGIHAAGVSDEAGTVRVEEFAQVFDFFESHE